MAYFERVGEWRFRATDHVGGAWNTDEQHVAPALGLLAHAVELDRDARRDDGLVVGRLSYDILGTMPIGVVEAAVRVLRPRGSVDRVAPRVRRLGGRAPAAGGARAGHVLGAHPAAARPGRGGRPARRCRRPVRHRQRDDRAGQPGGRRLPATST